MSGMKFGVCLPQYGREVSFDDLQLVAMDAEALGYDSVWASDHVVTPEQMHRNIGPIFLDVFTVLSHVSALTNRVRLGTTVLVTPYRNPLVAAKIIATLDLLSGGRVNLGVGAGGAPDEFAALGVPESQRGVRTDEYLSAMISLWTTDPSSFSGRHVNFDGVRFAPKPAQAPHPPIWVGGRSDAALRRAVRFGEAWHPTSTHLDTLRDRMASLAALSREAGRASPPVTTVHQGISFTTGASRSGERRIGHGAVEQVSDDIETYREMGIPAVVCNFRAQNTDEQRRAMETFARRVMSGFSG